MRDDGEDKEPAKVFIDASEDFSVDEVRIEDAIVMLANAVRLLAFHVERVRDEWQSREELRGIRDDMEGLIYTIKGRR